MCCCGASPPLVPLILSAPGRAGQLPRGSRSRARPRLTDIVCVTGKQNETRATWYIAAMGRGMLRPSLQPHTPNPMAPADNEPSNTPIPDLRLSYLPASTASLRLTLVAVMHPLPNARRQR